MGGRQSGRVRCASGSAARPEAFRACVRPSWFGSWRGPRHFHRGRFSLGQFPVAINRQGRPGLRPAGRPANGQVCHFRYRAESEQDAVVVARQVASASLDLPYEFLTRDFETQNRADGVCVGFADENGAEPVAAVFNGIAQEDHWLVLVADHDVGAAVVIEIAERRAAAHSLDAKVRSAASRDVLKADDWVRGGLLAKVAEKDRVLFLFAGRRGVRGDMAIGDEEVLGAVAIEVEEARAKSDEGETDRRDARGVAGVPELAAAAVAIERVRFELEVRDEQGKAAAAVVIRRVHSHASLRATL